MRRLCILAPLALFLATGCGHVVARPTVMARAERLGRSPASIEAARLAPEAYASAEKLRRDAEGAYLGGDPVGAQILSEHAIAAYEHALVLARLARASESARRTGAQLASAERSLAQIEEELGRTTASSNDIEARIKVARDAVPLAPVGRADWGRDHARLAASRSLGLDSTLLCAAARMLAPATSGLEQAEAAAADLQRRLVERPSPAPIELAMRARAGCLAALAGARRQASATSSVGKADMLLSELSAIGASLEGLEPQRDERGVIVTLRSPSDGTGLAPRLAEPIRAIAGVAKAHPDFPILVVVHGASGRKDEIAREHVQGGLVAKALADAGASPDRVEVREAGAAHLVVSPKSPSAGERNGRIEIVFVDPGG
jgi:hypothetical protein